MNFSNIKQIVVPEGAVKKITYNGATLWERISRYLKTVIGKVVTVTDALNEPAESLVVTFNPKQDLNGYDKPWITGNGKNLLNPILLKDQEAWNVIKIYADEGTILTASTSTPAGKGLLAYFRQPDGDQGTANGVVTAAQHKAVTQTVGSDGYVELVQRRSTGTDSFQNYNWQIEKGSSATSYEPYEGNICPIDGRTQLSVKHVDKNLFGGTALKNRILEIGGNDEGDNVVSIGSGTLASKILFNDFKPDTRYTFILTLSKLRGNTNANMRIYYTDGTGQYVYVQEPITDKQTLVITTKADASVKHIAGINASVGTVFYTDECGIFEGVLTEDEFEEYKEEIYVTSLSKNIWNKNIKNGDVIISGLVPGQRYTASAKMIDASTPTYCYIRRKLKTESEYTTVNEIIKNKTVKSVSFTVNENYDYSVWCNAAYGNVTDVQIEFGSVATEYEPYGTLIYGGTINLISGEAVIDKGFATFDGTETWTKNTRALNAFYTTRPQGCKQTTTMVSDKFIYVNNVQMLYNTYGTCYTGSSMNFSVNPETIGGDTIEDWTTWLTDNPLQVVYELTTPITYQLTPQQINMFKNNNSFTANENDISLTYWGTEQSN